MLHDKINNYIDCLENHRRGFNFENYYRNEQLFKSGKVALPPFKKTGTTICGIVCADGVVIAADTRATAGSIVADKNCSKLHRISDSIYCAGAGVSADLLHTTLWLESCAELHRLNTKTPVRVSYVVSIACQELFKYMGYKQCALVLGGVDLTGGHIYRISPHGSTDKAPYAAMGSGSLSALAVLENGYRDMMSLEEGRALVSEAISAGIFNDLGSGGNVDICTLTKAGAKHERGFVQPNNRIYRMPQLIKFAIGTTPVLREKYSFTKGIKNNKNDDNQSNNSNDVDTPMDG